jgi:hypothetical protein
VAELGAGGAILVLIGLFYTIAAIVTIRVGAINMLMTNALSALSSVEPRVQAAERNRGWLLGLMAVLYGAGGILLVFRLDIAAALFALSAVVYALYLHWIAPKFLDPWDPPEEPGRSSTKNAFLLYLGATAVVLAAWHAGALAPLSGQSPWVVTGAAALVLALAIYALHAFSPWRRYPRVALPMDDGLSPPLPQKLVMTPGWDGTGLVDAADGEPIWYSLSEKDMPQADWQDITAWNELFRDMADPDDPLGQWFRVADAEKRLEEAGRPVFERLARRLGADRIAFEPKPRPNHPQVEFSACRIFIDANGDPLQRIEGDAHHFLAPVRAGISWSLANALGDWAFRYGGRLDPGDIDAPPNWTPREEAAHRAEGRALAERLARELAATGRGHVAIWYDPYGTGAERVSA